MGERKGTNKYYPPDYDPKKGGLNKFMGTHALRERARKLHLGIMIIRFEMPYNIWCEGCNNHIGMGVRYNAEKTKVGMYYSTPVYQFRMKCHLCDNHFEIKTDPANLDYEIINGARRQERRWDPTENGQVVPDDKQVIHKLADDAMFKLQHGVEDQRKLTDVTPTLFKLENLQERWKDDYMANRALRDQFRARKREIQDQQNKDNEFLKKRSLDIQLLPELEDDAKVASLIRLQPAKSSEERQLEKRAAIDKKSKFPYLLAPPSTSTSADDKREIVEVDAAAPSVPVKTGIFMASCVESRRKSFGIKLKTDKTSSTLSPTAPTSSTNCSTNSNEPASSSLTGAPSAAVTNDMDDIKSPCGNKQLGELEMPSENMGCGSTPNNASSSSTTESESNTILSSKCTPESVSHGHSTGKCENVPSSEKVTNVEPHLSSLARLSSLVSYSDDSNNSSTGSQSD